MRRLLYTIGIIAVIVAVLLLGYFFRSRPGGESEGEPITGNTTGVLPGGTPTPVTGGSGGELPAPGGQHRFGVVAQNPVADYFVTDKDEVFIIQPDGQIVRVTNNQEASVTTSTIEKLIRASFSKDGTRLLTVSGDPRAPRSRMFNLEDRTWHDLPEIIREPTWSPVDHRLAFFAGNATGSTRLFTYDLDKPKTDPKVMFTFHGFDVTIFWPRANAFVLAERGSVMAKTSAWRIDVARNIFVPLALNETGMQVGWGDATDQGLVFTAKENTPVGKLSLVQSDGQATLLSFATLPSKCAFGSREVRLEAPTSTAQAATSSVKGTKKEPPRPTTSTAPFLVCGVPQTIPRLYRRPFPDGYLKRVFFTTDGFYEIDLKSGDTKTLHDERIDLDAMNSKVFNNQFFFVNRYDSKLYAISLTP